LQRLATVDKMSRRIRKGKRAERKLGIGFGSVEYARMEGQRASYIDKYRPFKNMNPYKQGRRHDAWKEGYETGLSREAVVALSQLKRM
jgi:hypothetical protein